jgi:predicted ThiF/HesA family dinucleotide-utilizing enzyme
VRLAFLILEFGDADMDRVVDIQGQFYSPDDATYAQIGAVVAEANAELLRLRAEHPGMTLALVSTQRVG